MNQIPTVITASIETAINQVLSMDPDTLERLKEIQGKVIALQLKGLDITLFLIPGDHGLNIYSHFEGQPDTTLSGTPVGMLRMGLAKNAGDSFFSGDVSINGDVELGSQFQEILDGLDIDWEEHLSRIIGDATAHKIGNVLRDASQWGRQTLDTLVRDSAEYLQEESRDLPNRFEMEAFLDDIDELRSDVDRLEARINRLANNLSKTYQETPQ